MWPCFVFGGSQCDERFGAKHPFHVCFEPDVAADDAQDSASALITQEGHVQPAADVQRIVSEARHVVVV